MRKGITFEVSAADPLRLDAIEPDDVVQFLGKSLVFRQFEAAPALRRKAVLVPDLDDRRRREPNGLCHRKNGPVGGLLPERFQSQSNHPVDEVTLKRRRAWGQALVAVLMSDEGLGTVAIMEATAMSKTCAGVGKNASWRKAVFCVSAGRSPQKHVWRAL